MINRILPAAGLAALSACSSPSETEQPAAPATESSPAAPTSGPNDFDGTATGTLAPSTSPSASPPPDHVGDPPPPVTAVDPAARRIALSGWRKSEKPETCAPLALKSDAGAGGKARRANFSGGWGVAFDQPALRSAYGFAGTGFIPQDANSVQKQRARLAAQWPYFREITQLPKPSYAGYGVEGAEDYPRANPDGNGLNSIAYVRVGGQGCDYNVWSRLGRAHLEHLLANLVMVPTS
ncbi:hypothetical protein B0I00_0119 [Novosphingobium kunmingense]|uniref:Uncharacterized protein n=1 Tax=Novosphingobium kunmingense TaxID=1211806 RepID=A0A2N0I180_9SPHN|nr:hypothetical protein [Novosphingobium kunmingense]PKB24940.1 hypothetical protein B0I00_0119 [Novosphingobium kunmingense]